MFYDQIKIFKKKNSKNKYNLQFEEEEKNVLGKEHGNKTRIAMKM